MSLVDKLEGVHKGTILFLKGNGFSAVGHVINYSMKSVTLSTEEPYDFGDNRKERKLALIGTGPVKVFSKDRKYGLKHFNSYEILIPKKK